MFRSSLVTLEFRAPAISNNLGRKEALSLFYLRQGAYGAKEYVLF